MRVLTFNVWNYAPRWATRRDLLIELIAACAPDVVALQETRHDFRYERGHGQGEQVAERTGYHATGAISQVYIPVLRVDEGLTILTRTPPLDTEVCSLTLLPHERQDENHRICLAVRIEQGGQEVHIFDTHFSLSPRARLSNAREVADFVSRRAGEQPAVLMGDLNADPSTPEIRFLRGEIDLDGMRASFTDCWTAANPGQPGFTYASFNPYHRIDYIFQRNFTAPPGPVTLVGGESRDGVFLSDHLGILADLPL